MHIASGWSVQPDPETAAEEAFARLRGELGGAPQLLLVHAACGYDSRRLLDRLAALAPAAALHGGTTCMGVLTAAGYHTAGGRGLGLLGVHDPAGSYGVGSRPLLTDTAGATRAALDAALAAAQRPGEVPAVVLVATTPGSEERVIAALEAHIGADVPIIGGTSADNDMSGQWRQFGNTTVTTAGVSVAALFPTAAVGYAFHGGYEPAGPAGRVTRAVGRILYEIDGRPAAQVYNGWTEGLITAALEGGSLVPTASLRPLGTQVGQVRGVPYFRLSYPVAVLAKGALELFTEIADAAEVALMRGTADSLVARAGRVAAAAVAAAPFAPADTLGALVLFCTGCMLVVPERLPEAAAGLRAALHGAPFLTSFTLGEQGCFIGGENRHGNLMIAVLAFGRPGGAVH